MNSTETNMTETVTPAQPVAEVTPAVAKRPVGAPQKPVVFPKTVFTIVDLATKNPGICTLTLRNRVKAGLASQSLIKLATKLAKDAKAGAPVKRYMLKAQYDANQTNLAKAAARKAQAEQIPADQTPAA